MLILITLAFFAGLAGIVIDWMFPDIRSVDVEAVSLLLIFGSMLTGVIYLYALVIMSLETYLTFGS